MICVIPTLAPSSIPNRQVWKCTEKSDSKTKYRDIINVAVSILKKSPTALEKIPSKVSKGVLQGIMR